MKTARYVSFLGGAIMLSGCAGTAVDRLSSTEPTGSPFTQELARQYRDFATFEAEQMYDWVDANYFAEKGLSAAAGEAVPPEELANWDLPENRIGELTDARTQLTDALNAGARENSPTNAAIAQAKFDCWVEQQEENHQEDHIAACRDEFFAAVETLVTPALPEAPSVYFVFFDWDQADVTEAGQAIIDQVTRDFQAAGAQSIEVVGHTDTSGSNDYNLSLGERRADAVRQALVSGGLPAGGIDTGTRGETELLVQTPDSVREPSNRRAEIRFQ